MCNCSKQITESECQRLRKYVKDPLSRTFIYHVFDDTGLKVAFVPPEKNPNQIAIERGFLDENGNPEWYHVSEHPCLNE